MSLDILITTKNNEYYWTHHFPKIWNNLILYNPTYYIYENNSTDKTRLKLEELQKTYPNIIIFLEGSRTYLNRYLNVTIARQRLLELYREKRIVNENKDDINNYVLLLDTLIAFPTQSISRLMLAAKENPNGSMFCAFTKYFSINHSPEYYYDILAYNYGKYYMTKISPRMTFDFMLKDNRQHNSKIVDVETAFGGLALLKKDIFLKTQWKFHKPVDVRNENIGRNMICEHWFYSQEVRKYGSIFIVRDVEAVWFTDTDLRQHTSKIDNFIQKYY